MWTVLTGFSALHFFPLLPAAFCGSRFGLRFSSCVEMGVPVHLIVPGTVGDIVPYSRMAVRINCMPPTWLGEVCARMAGTSFMPSMVSPAFSICFPAFQRSRSFKRTPSAASAYPPPPGGSLPAARAARGSRAPADLHQRGNHHRGMTLPCVQKRVVRHGSVARPLVHHFGGALGPAQTFASASLSSTSA